MALGRHRLAQATSDQLLSILPPGTENVSAAVHSLLRSPDQGVCDALDRFGR